MSSDQPNPTAHYLREVAAANEELVRFYEKRAAHEKIMRRIHLMQVVAVLCLIAVHLWRLIHG